MPFELAAQVHSTAGLLLVPLYIFFVIANIISGNWWQYVPKPGAFGDKIMSQARFAVLHYLVGLLIAAFVIAHIYLGSYGSKVKTHYKMMITGWHED